MANWSDVEPAGLLQVNQVFSFYAESIKWKYDHFKKVLTVTWKDTSNLDDCIQDLKNVDLGCAKKSVNSFTGTITIKF